jgi:hypothetical protein
MEGAIEKKKSIYCFSFLKSMRTELSTPSKLSIAPTIEIQLQIQNFKCTFYSYSLIAEILEH